MVAVAVIALAAGTLSVYRATIDWNVDFRGGVIMLQWRLKSQAPQPFLPIPVL